jgi:hypothetical protein
MLPYFSLYQVEMKMNRLSLPIRMSHLAIFALTIIVILETSLSTSPLSKIKKKYDARFIEEVLDYFVDMACLTFRN